MFNTLFAWWGTVIPGLIPLVLFGCAYAAGVEYLHAERGDVSLEMFTAYYNSHLMLTTFLLSWYLGTCHSARQSVLGKVRSVQGRANDLQLLFASHTRDMGEECSAYCERATNYILAAVWVVERESFLVECPYTDCL